LDTPIRGVRNLRLGKPITSIMVPQEEDYGIEE
jgi:hypothetical protein